MADLDKYNDLITVIIPVYNTEKYIRRCLDSVVHQTYQNLQIIIIDDGSTDNSGEICKEYASKDNRIVYYYQENAGQAAARNRALELMSGQYVSFVDADDYVVLDFLERLHSELIRVKAQIAVCNYERICDGAEASKDNQTDMRISLMSGKELLYQFVEKDPIVTDVLWNKMFESNLFLDIAFPEGKIYEDFFVCDKLLYECKKVVYVDFKLYFYLINDNSTTGKIWTPKNVDILEQLQIREAYYEENEEAYLLGMTRFDVAIYSLAFFYYFIKKDCTTTVETDLFIQIYKSKIRYLLMCNHLPLLKKIFILLGYFFPILCGKISAEKLR